MFLGAVLGFAHAAKSWLAIRVKDGKRCVPKVFLWRGIRNLIASVGAFVAILSVGSATSSTATTTGPPEAIGLLFAAMILFAMGFGIGNGLSNLTGGTLSYATEGPYQPTPSNDEEVSPSTDKYGQLTED
ncbi:hypothetical protein C463_16886 [Halorubrum californiense DSM 19288]|uniref:Uncharacterized protein n=2 Tax=Halorubrum californiense TaxID=416585 RepID=M0DW07_9EURY|nr:hypothetical protein [Halorubrum sp. GN11GM_10-3_MGM]ELZ39671.1 hypothetical protein C463_16886 [Halorubrum californiense DSM 19288]TKX67746.1 hypothetical protein EXE40_14440 [Halorubrum sp. GN11GM_10-3_MGM]